MDMPVTLVPVRTSPSPEDRILVGLFYRAMRMMAAAIKERYGITIRVEMVDR